MVKKINTGLTQPFSFYNMEAWFHRTMVLQNLLSLKLFSQNNYGHKQNMKLSNSENILKVNETLILFSETFWCKIVKKCSSILISKAVVLAVVWRIMEWLFKVVIIMQKKKISKTLDYTHCNFWVSKSAQTLQWVFISLSSKLVELTYRVSQKYQTHLKNS